jgi:HAD superfamily hydrolase (TIGR01549 family)
MHHRIDISKVKGVLFDLGGTLIEYINDPPKSVFENFKSHLSPDDPQIKFHDFKALIDSYWIHMQNEFYTAPEDLSILEYNRRFLVKHGFSDATSQRMSKPFSDMIFKLELEGTRLKDSAIELLDLLKSKNLKIGIITNASHNEKRIRQILRKVGIERYFETLVISSEVGIKKPDPGIFLIALKNLELKHDEAVYVGDRIEYDAKGAENEGMQFILVSKDFGLKKVAEIFRG